MKPKFNKEERRAIISKLRRVADEREAESWKQLRDQYTPSEEYLELKKLLDSYVTTEKELRSKFIGILPGYYFHNIDIEDCLNSQRDKELRPFVNRYRINENMLEVELILTGNTAPLDEIIENLLNLCK